MPARTNRSGESGAVLMVLHGSGLARRALFWRGPDTSQILTADPDGSKRDKQGKQRDSRRGEEPAGEPGGEGMRR